MFGVWTCYYMLDLLMRPTKFDPLTFSINLCLRTPLPRIPSILRRKPKYSTRQARGLTSQGAVGYLRIKEILISLYSLNQHPKDDEWRDVE